MNLKEILLCTSLIILGVAMAPQTVASVHKLFPSSARTPVIITEGAQYFVPDGKLLVVTGAGATGETTLGRYDVRVGLDNDPAPITFTLAVHVDGVGPSVEPVPFGLVLDDTQKISVGNPISVDEGRIYGYLINE